MRGFRGGVLGYQKVAAFVNAGGPASSSFAAARVAPPVVATAPAALQEAPPAAPAAAPEESVPPTEVATAVAPAAPAAPAARGSGKLPRVQRAGGKVRVGKGEFDRLKPVGMDQFSSSDMSKFIPYVQKHLPGDPEKWMNILLAESGGKWDAYGDTHAQGSIGLGQINKKYNPAEFDAAQKAVSSRDYDAYFKAMGDVARKSPKNPYALWTTGKQFGYA